MAALKKKIWMYWHQGFDQANEIVHQCIKSWRHYNPDWEVILLDQSNVSQYVGPINIPSDKLSLLKIQHRSDLIRTQLLVRYGGVWADPTCFCNKPLNEWLPEYLQSGLFFFYKPARERLIANWFIAVDGPNNHALIKLYDTLCEYWTKNNFRNHYKKYPEVERMLERLVNRKPILTRLWLSPLFTKIIRLYPYMIYHYTFNRLVSTDAAFRDSWEKTKKLPAAQAMAAQRLGLLNSVTDQSKQLITGKETPIFKLNWKIDVSKIQEGTLIKYLFNSLE